MQLYCLQRWRPYYVIFVDATDLPLEPHDWDEAAKIADTCSITFVVSMYAPGDSQTMKPLIRPGVTAETAVQTAEPLDIMELSS